MSTNSHRVAILVITVGDPMRKFATRACVGVRTSTATSTCSMDKLHTVFEIAERLDAKL